MPIPGALDQLRESGWLDPSDAETLKRERDEALDALRHLYDKPHVFAYRKEARATLVKHGYRIPLSVARSVSAVQTQARKLANEAEDKLLTKEEYLPYCASIPWAIDAVATLDQMSADIAWLLARSPHLTGLEDAGRVKEIDRRWTRLGWLKKEGM